MSKSKKRDLWTYAIVALLIINLYVINNYITQRALTIIEDKNDVNTSAAVFHPSVLKDGIVAKYMSISDSVKNIVGINDANLSQSTSIKANANNYDINHSVKKGLTNVNDKNLSITNRIIKIPQKPNSNNITKAISAGIPQQQLKGGSL